MADPDVIVARNSERLARLARGEAAQRARARSRGRTQASLKRRVRRAVMVAAALILTPILYGLIIGPIGTTALVLLVLAGALAIAAAFLFDPAAASAQSVEAAPMDQLPTVTDAWLDARRRELPAAAAPHIDAISNHLATLGTQLVHVEGENDVTQDLDRLLKKHLPGLVDRYTKVPAAQRAADPGLEATLVSGLALVERELARASKKLSEADRDAVHIQGRFLENRYGETDINQAG
jgi:hypothetical protein